MRTRAETVAGALQLHRVLDPDHAALLRRLQDLSGTKTARKFPGSNPCSLERADYPKLRSQPYFLAEKTNGVRFLLFCCEHAGHKVCALVDRAMATFLLPLQCLPTVVFEGTIVDCELALNRVEQRWELLAFDTYVVSGIPVFHMPFSNRMAAIQRAMSVYAPQPQDPVSVRMKSFVPASLFDQFATHEHDARRFFDTDGIVLVPELSHAVIGRHTELFKLKTKHTVDFLVGGDGVELSVYDPGGPRSHRPVACLRTPTQAGAIAECVWDGGLAGGWVLVCLRTDKTTANDALTYERTLVNMQEGITVDEIRAVFRPPST